MDGGRRHPDPATFAQGLAGLKRTGGTLLLVGANCERAHHVASNRLLGSDDAEEPRHRLLVLVGPDARPEPRLAGIDPTTTRVMSYGQLTRGAGAALAEPAADWATGGSSRIGSEIAEAVGSAAGARGGFGPAELRVCLDSTVALLAAFGADGTRELIDGLADAVRAHHGLAHVHLPLPADDPRVVGLVPLFDAVVELREGPEGPEQRWLLTDGGAGTGWVGVTGAGRPKR